MGMVERSELVASRRMAQGIQWEAAREAARAEQEHKARELAHQKRAVMTKYYQQRLKESPFEAKAASIFTTKKLEGKALSIEKLNYVRNKLFLALSSNNIEEFSIYLGPKTFGYICNYKRDNAIIFEKWSHLWEKAYFFSQMEHQVGLYFQCYIQKLSRGTAPTSLLEGDAVELQRDAILSQLKEFIRSHWTAYQPENPTTEIQINHKRNAHVIPSFLNQQNTAAATYPAAAAFEMAVLQSDARTKNLTTTLSPAVYERVESLIEHYSRPTKAELNKWWEEIERMVQQQPTFAELLYALNQVRELIQSEMNVLQKQQDDSYVWYQKAITQDKAQFEQQTQKFLAESEPVGEAFHLIFQSGIESISPDHELLQGQLTLNPQSNTATAPRPEDQTADEVIENRLNLCTTTLLGAALRRYFKAANPKEKIIHLNLIEKLLERGASPFYLVGADKRMTALQYGFGANIPDWQVLSLIAKYMPTYSPLTRHIQQQLLLFATDNQSHWFFKRLNSQAAPARESFLKILECARLALVDLGESALIKKMAEEYQSLQVYTVEKNLSLWDKPMRWIECLRSTLDKVEKQSLPYYSSEHVEKVLESLSAAKEETPFPAQEATAAEPEAAIPGFNSCGW